VSEVREVTCIVCPVGCRVRVWLEGGRVVRVEGNLCPRGAAYAASEATHPVREFFAVVRVKGGDLPVVSVRSDRPVPKGAVLSIVRELSRVRLRAPVRAGEVVLANVGGLGVNIVATRTVKRAERGPAARDAFEPPPH